MISVEQSLAEIDVYIAFLFLNLDNFVCCLLKINPYARYFIF